MICEHSAAWSTTPDDRITHARVRDDLVFLSSDRVKSGKLRVFSSNRTSIMIDRNTVIDTWRNPYYDVTVYVSPQHTRASAAQKQSVFVYNDRRTRTL